MRYLYTAFQAVIFQLLILFSVSAQADVEITNKKTAFVSNEKLIYRVKYGFIKGGEASIKILTEPSGDYYLYHIYSLARSTGFIGSIYPVKDIYESYADINTLYPVKSIRNITEKKYNSYNEVLFFREQGFLRSLNTGDHPAPENVLDVLSAFYFARNILYLNQVKEGEKIPFLIYFDEKFLSIEIKLAGIENIDTEFGKVNCLKFIPYSVDNNLFKSNDQFKLWVTADSNFIPVKIRVKLSFGSLKCDLIDFENIKNSAGQLKKQD
ncbi:MAG: DUF3108 domain-containing protein [Bacteroidales bacterium]